MRIVLAAVCLIAMPSSVNALEPSDQTSFDCQLKTYSGQLIALRGSFQGTEISANFSDLPASRRDGANGKDRAVVSARGQQGLCITSGPQVCQSRWTASMNDGELIDIELQDWYNRGVASAVLNSRWHVARHSNGAPLALGYCSTKRKPDSAVLEETQ